MAQDSKRTIRDDNAELNALADLIAWGTAMPAGTELNRMAMELRDLPSLPDRFNAAFLEQGWVYVNFACSYAAAERALAMRVDGAEQLRIDEYLAGSLLNIEPIKRQSLKIFGGGVVEPLYPVRAQIAERIFQAYDAGDYLVGIPLILMLVDGFGVSATGTKSMFSNLDSLDDLFQSAESVAGHPSALKGLLRNLRKNQSGYSEEKLMMPLRNGILHGVRLNYNNNIVAAKTLNLLAAVVEWARDVAPEPEDEIEKRKWNTKFLQSNLSRLQPTSPERALTLFQSALKAHRATDLVALIEYHPTLTLLSEKIRQWRELETEEIEIEPCSNWEILGKPTDSEQYASCQIRLRVKASNGKVTDGELTLHAKRSAELARANLPSVWQIGLDLQGAIQQRLLLE